MSFTRIHSLQLDGLDHTVVTIETDIAKGLFAFTIVGLPDKAVEEARDRVSSALKNAGFTSPKQQNAKVVVSLSPADIKKEGGNFDVAIAIGYLVASQQLQADIEDAVFVGELGLNGDVRPVRGILPITQAAKQRGFKKIYVPDANKYESALVQGIEVYPVAQLLDLILHLSREHSQSIAREPATEVEYVESDTPVKFEHIRGQAMAKRGLLIAAAGGHNIAMYGPPGTGKTMLARAFAALLPPLTMDEILEVTGIHSIAGISKNAIITQAPFRAPHATASYVSIIGGGSVPKPGEVTLSHRGVLFLDEFPEFDKRVIESLRQPLEDRYVTITRSKGHAVFPTKFMLVAAMNPPDRNATASDRARFERKLSGPIMDRVDLWVHVDSVSYDDLGQAIVAVGDTTEDARKQVANARRMQQERLKDVGCRLNAEMNVVHIDSLLVLAPEVRSLLNDGAKRLKLSARSYHRMIKLARTIADLEGSADIGVPHVLEALQFRPKIEY